MQFEEIIFGGWPKPDEPGFVCIAYGLDTEIGTIFIRFTVIRPGNTLFLQCYIWIIAVKDINWLNFWF